jgi:hypothetical protein
MEKPSSSIRQAAEERTRLIQLVAGLSDAQSNYKPTPQTWSANENLEHLVLAEISGVSKSGQQQKVCGRVNPFGKESILIAVCLSKRLLLARGSQRKLHRRWWLPVSADRLRIGSKIFVALNSFLKDWNPFWMV